MPTKTNEGPTKVDAVFGRGGKHNTLRADTFLREATEANWAAYCSIKPSDYIAKRRFVREKFIAPIAKEGGRFLKCKNGSWFELCPDVKKDLREIETKIAQSLRDVKKKYHPIPLPFAPATTHKSSNGKINKSSRSKTTMSLPVTCRSNLSSSTTLRRRNVIPCPPALATTIMNFPNTVSPTVSRRGSVHEVSDDSDCESEDSFFPFPMISTATLMTLQSAREIIDDFEADWGADNEFFSSDTASLEKEVAALVQNAQRSDDGGMSALEANVEREMNQILGEQEMPHGTTSRNNNNQVDFLDGSNNCGLHYYRA